MSNWSSSVRKSFVVVGLILGTASLAHAQATRTWVSGVGNDANPCSRTAPCKTFAGAISKTATGGFIDVVDPGGFGTVTITKSITIEGGGEHAGVLTLNTNGIIVNGGGIFVTLRHLSIESPSAGQSGLNGINVISAAEVHIEHCVINGFSNNAINFGASANAKGFVTDTTLIHNANGGVVVASGRVTVSNLHANANGNGVAVTGAAIATVRDSYAAGGSVGFAAIVNEGAVLTCDGCVTTNNSFGVVANTGGTVRLSNSLVSSNSNTGLSNDGISFIVSLQGNSVVGNVTDGVFTSTVIKQ
jgi:hypothetical protein